jgi:predicted phage terminase large subunit-like protein
MSSSKDKLTPEQFEYALRNREQVLRDIDAYDCNRSLINFVRIGWRQIEPETPFVDGWAVEAVCEHLEAVTRGEIRRLLINIPPGCMKSLTSNVFWPAWEWGPQRSSHLRFISASYEKGLATRDLVRCRDLLFSDWYQALWPLQFKGDQNLKTYYENENRGWRLAASVGSSLIGYRGDRIVVDDPHDVKSAESEVKREESLRWFTEVLPTRLNNQMKSTIVVVMQRLHERDISGLITSKLSADWEHLMLPMEYESKRKCVIQVTGFSDPRDVEGELLWPERFDADSVERLKNVFRSQGGTYAEAAQLQQRPAPRGGGMFKRKDFEIVDQVPAGGRSVRGWDLAASTGRTSAYTVGAKLTLCQGKLYIEDIARDRLTPSGVEKLIIACAERDGRVTWISIPQDPGQAGKAQRARLAQLLHGYRVHFSAESGSKEDRATPLAAQVEAGNVFVVRAPWNDAFLTEAEMFPTGEFLDQIDALSRAYAKLLTDRGRTIATQPGLIIT